MPRIPVQFTYHIEVKVTATDHPDVVMVHARWEDADGDNDESWALQYRDDVDTLIADLKDPSDVCRSPIWVVSHKKLDELRERGLEANNFAISLSIRSAGLRVPWGRQLPSSHVPLLRKKGHLRHLDGSLAVTSFGFMIETTKEFNEELRERLQDPDIPAIYIPQSKNRYSATSAYPRVRFDLTHEEAEDWIARGLNERGRDRERLETIGITAVQDAEGRRFETLEPKAGQGPAP